MDLPPATGDLWCSVHSATGRDDLVHDYMTRCARAPSMAGPGFISAPSRTRAQGTRGQDLRGKVTCGFVIARTRRRCSGVLRCRRSGEYRGSFVACRVRTENSARLQDVRGRCERRRAANEDFPPESC